MSKRPPKAVRQDVQPSAKLEGDTFTLTLPWPPSVNHYWRPAIRKRRNGQMYSRILLTEGAERYRADALESLFRQGFIPLGPDAELELEEIYYPPTNADRDIDNFRKAYRDAMTHAGVWGDDKQITKDGGEMMPRDKDNPRVEVTIRIRERINP
jgi:crossover junction endodeoxyribonuclease RusA